MNSECNMSRAWVFFLTIAECSRQRRRFGRDFSLGCSTRLTYGLSWENRRRDAWTDGRIDRGIKRSIPRCTAPPTRSAAPRRANMHTPTNFASDETASKYSRRAAIACLPPVWLPVVRSRRRRRDGLSAILRISLPIGSREISKRSSLTFGS